MISPVEHEALLIVSLIIAQCLGHPRQQGEVCAFSIPADPIDVERNVIYHRGALETVLRKLGYTPRPMLEGHSIVFAELKEENYTGIGISCGGGMFNVCVAYKSVPALTFATSRGGDWIDNNVSAAIGMPAPQVCALKESGVDLMNPKDRVQDAIVIYYRNLIQYTLETIKQKLEAAQNLPTFTKPISVVCGGGTSMIQGFIDVFREEFERVNFPMDVAEIRMARNPLKAVSAGCMEAAIEETRAMADTAPVTISQAALERSAVSSSVKVDDGTKRRLALGRAASPAMERTAPAAVVKSSPAPAAVATEGDTSRRAAPAKVEAPKPKQDTKVRPAPPPPKPAPLEELIEVEELEIEELPAEPKKKPVEPDDSGDIPLIS
jgi:hypothetical protein